MPDNQRTDDRYELLTKFQGVLKSLGSDGVIVLVDRVDEPHLITGSVERMRALVWPMLDNKFLKQPGFGLKMLLPAELVAYMEKEDRDFYQRARLDKQNMIPSLEWSGESLYDLANARVKSCAAEGRDAQTPRLDGRFDHRPAAGRIIPHVASPAAFIQIPVSSTRGPLPRAHRRESALESRARNV